MARSPKKRVPFKVYHPLANISKGETDADFVEHLGPKLTEGMQTRVFDQIITPRSTASFAVVTLPAGSIVDATWMNVNVLLVAAGTSATCSLGISGDVDNLGTLTSDTWTTQADSKAAGKKWTGVAGSAIISGAGDHLGVQNTGTLAVVLSAAAAGGASAGDSAFTAGTVRVRIQYRVPLVLPTI